MLLRFRVANFRSLRDEQELSMVASLPEGRKDLVPIPSLGIDTVRVAAIYGANAAGTSNVLAALEFLRSAVLNSHSSWKPEGPIPLKPFALGSSLTAASTSRVRTLLQRQLPDYRKELPYERLAEGLESALDRARQLQRRCEEERDLHRNPSTGVSGWWRKSKRTAWAEGQRASSAPETPPPV
jgi:hypothetical protein